MTLKVDRDRLYVLQMLELAERISRHTSGGKGAFHQSEMAQDAVLRNFEVIGEISKRVSDALKKETPQIAWTEMARFRDLLIHGYDRIELSEVWSTVEIHVPKLMDELRKLAKHRGWK